jgi:hypothetical protein
MAEWTLPTHHPNREANIMRKATDKMGRKVTIIPDAMAVALREASHAGWVEIVGMADGYSRDYAPGTVPHTLATELLDYWRADGAATCLVVGESGWDDAAAWWAPSTSHSGFDMRFHVGPLPVRNRDGSIRFAG